MNNRQKKKRFSALITEQSYNKVNNFVKDNEIVTGKLAPGTILELGILLFFKELETRPFQDIVVEYLSNDSEIICGGGVDE